jgi:hypothetical protein
MNTTIVPKLASWVFATCLLTLLPAYGDDKGDGPVELPPAPGQKKPVAAVTPKLPTAPRADELLEESNEALESDATEPIDPAFERYVDLELLARARRELDASLLTDCALQFVRAENILFRSHALIEANQLLKLAVRMATESKDKETLDRLSKAVDKLRNNQLAVQIKVAQSLVAETRALDPSVSVNVREMTAKTYAIYRQLLNSIRDAKIAGDLDYLAKAESSLASVTGLHEKEKSFLQKQIKEARTSIPENAAGVNAALSKLTSASCGRFGLGNVIGGRFGRSGNSSSQNSYGSNYSSSNYSGTTHSNSASTATAPATSASTSATPGEPIVGVFWFEEKIDSAGNTYWVARLFKEDGKYFAKSFVRNATGQLTPRQDKVLQGTYVYDQSKSRLTLDGASVPYDVTFSLKGTKLDFRSASGFHTWRNRKP